jgi:hypothetical protein
MLLEQKSCQQDAGVPVDGDRQLFFTSSKKIVDAPFLQAYILPVQKQ